MDTKKRAIDLVPAGMVLATVLLAGFLLKLNFADGTYDDEYATLWLSDPAISLRVLYAGRWAGETNPPLYYLLYWIVRHISDAGLAALRAGNLVFLATSMAYLTVSAMRQARFRPFLAAVAILFLSSADQFRYFIELRSYYWQITWSFAFCVSLALLLGRPRDRVDRLDSAVFAVTLFVLVNVHFTSALLAALIAAAAIAYAARRGDWRLARFLTLAALVCGGVGAVFVLLRLGTLSAALGGFWIATTSPQAARLMAAVARGAISHNVVMLGLLGLAFYPLARRRPAASGEQAPALADPFAIALVFALAVLTFFVVLCGLNFFRPIVILRYVVVAGAPLAVAGCLCVANLLQRRPILLAALLANGVAVAIPLAAQPSWPRDEAAGRALAQFHAACPQTPILGIVHGDPAGISETAYRTLSRRFGIAIETHRVIGAWSAPRNPTCPTVIWTPHTFDLVDPQRPVTAAQLAQALQLRLTEDDLARAAIHPVDGADPILVLPPLR